MQTCGHGYRPIISPHVGFRFSAFAGLMYDGVYVRVPAGGLIGRATHSSLRIEGPGVSEAHALLTLRDQEMRIMALRGEIMVGGQPLTEVALVPGLDIQLAPAVILHVRDIVLPALALALVIDGVPCVVQRLPCTLLARGDLPPGTNAHVLGDALALLDERFSGGLLEIREAEDGLIAQTDGACIRFDPPREWRLLGHTVRVVAIPHSGTAETSEQRQRGEVAGLRISVRYDTVHIWALRPAPVLLSGIPARIISELVLLGRGPVSWDTLAREIWADRAIVRMTLRDNWDKGLQRLRKRLHDHGVREDLVRTDRHGNVELVLHRGDILTNDTGER